MSKYMFISDIHGNVEMLSKCTSIFEKEKMDKLIILGDTSAGYYDEEKNWLLAEIINSLGDKVEVIRGNCDSSDFEEKLDQEMFDDDILYINNVFISIEHGHRHNMYNLPQNCGDIFIQGHTHIPVLIKQGGRILANPGSVSRPRGTDLRCYILVDEEKIALYTLDGEFINEIKLKGNNDE